jgi:O-antigen/teichoic acid export membrane protein
MSVPYQCATSGPASAAGTAAGTGTVPGTGEPHATAGASAARQHIRGSSLLLVGRFISVLLNFAAQVLTVRYLSKSDYGAFAYGIGVAALGSSVVLVGLGRGIPRLVPIYQERKQFARMFGGIVLAAITVGVLGLLVVALLWAFQGVVGRVLITDNKALSVLLILIALAPLDAFDNVLQQLAAVFTRPKVIFFRRQVFGPAFKVVAIAAVMLLHGDVYLLAIGYLAGPFIGICLYVAVLVGEWRRQGLWSHLHLGALELPVRELFGFSLPLLSSDLSVVMRSSVVVMMLGYFQSTGAVAEYRAVLPVAGLNMLVFEAFGFLFTPLASRMFARGDHDGISQLFWQTSLWITVLTFPVLLVTCALAEPLTVVLFGQRYAHAGTLLAVLAIGHYFNAALGFNGATLRVYGKVRLIVVSDLVVIASSVVLSLVLIQRYGAMGAAVATTASLILQNIVNHLGLWLGRTGVELFEWRFVRVYGLVMLLTMGALAGQWFLTLPFYVSIAVAAVVTALMLRVTRGALRPEVMFPEVLRIPFVRRVLA